MFASTDTMKKFYNSTLSKSFSSISSLTPSSSAANPSNQTNDSKSKINPCKEDQIKLELNGGERGDTFVLIPSPFTLKPLTLKLPFFNFTYTFNDKLTTYRSSIDNTITVWPTSIHSIHDRSCEVFYQLLGGTTNYGIHHATKFNHNQYGQTFPGLFKSWSAENPIVLVGEGSSAQVVLYLQYLLSIDYFKVNSSANWIKACISVKGNLQGTPLFYLLGFKEHSKSVIYPFSLVQLFLTVLHLLLYFNFGWLYLFNLESVNKVWNMDWRSDGNFLLALFGRSSLFQNCDNFLYDESTEGSNWSTQLYHLNPSTVYLNYVADGTTLSPITKYHLPKLSFGYKFLISYWLGSYVDIKFRENEGLVPVQTQLPPSKHKVHFNLTLNHRLLDPILYKLQPGAWHNVYVKSWDDLRLFNSQHKFYTIEPNRYNLQSLVQSLEPTFFTVLLTLESISCMFSFRKRAVDIPRNNEGDELELEGSSFIKFDEVGRKFAKDCETKAFMQSPSAIIKWMQQSHKNELLSNEVNFELALSKVKLR